MDVSLRKSSQRLLVVCMMMGVLLCQSTALHAVAPQDKARRLLPAVVVLVSGDTLTGYAHAPNYRKTIRSITLYPHERARDGSKIPAERIDYATIGEEYRLLGMDVDMGVFRGLEIGQQRVLAIYLVSGGISLLTFYYDLRQQQESDFTLRSEVIGKRAVRPTVWGGGGPLISRANDFGSRIFYVVYGRQQAYFIQKGDVYDRVFYDFLRRCPSSQHWLEKIEEDPSDEQRYLTDFFQDINECRSLAYERYNPPYVQGARSFNVGLYSELSETFLNRGVVFESNPLPGDAIPFKLDDYGAGLQLGINFGRRGHIQARVAFGFRRTTYSLYYREQQVDDSFANAGDVLQQEDVITSRYGNMSVGLNYAFLPRETRVRPVLGVYGSFEFASRSSEICDESFLPRSGAGTPALEVIRNCVPSEDAVGRTRTFGRYALLAGVQAGVEAKVGKAWRVEFLTRFGTYVPGNTGEEGIGMSQLAFRLVISRNLIGVKRTSDAPDTRER